MENGTKKYRRGTLYKRGNVYWLKFNLNGRRISQSLHTSNKDTAEEEQAKIMRPILAAEKADALAVMTSRLAEAKADVTKIAEEKTKPLSLKEAWPAYLRAQNRPRRAGDTTLFHYEGHIKAFIKFLRKHHPSAVYMKDVTPEDAAAFIENLDRNKRSGNRINKYLQFLRTLFRVLAKPARMTVNPFSDISRREHISHTKRPLTVQELRNIIEKATGEWRTLYMVGTFTGLRLGDCANLQWGEVDIDRGIIRRIPNKTRRTGQAVIIGIPAILSNHLASLERKTPLVMPGLAKLYVHDQSAVCKQIQQHFTDCGIITNTKIGERRAVTEAGFHSLRHSFVSMHAQAGTSQAILMKLAGHGNPMMSEHYTHISESTARSTAQALPAILEDAKPIPSLPEPRLIPADAVRKLAEKLTAKNGLQIKEKLIALIGNDQKQ